MSFINASILFIIISYLIGSIPTGYLIVKYRTNQDIRTIGSGSTGATNVKRVLGKEWFFACMLLDAIKGIVPVVIAKFCDYIGLIDDRLGFIAVISSIFVIIGHSKPIFLQFRGGKSVASSVGTILALNPLAGLIIAVIWATITYLSRYVSLGSMIALSLSPFIMHFLDAPVFYTAYCTLAAFYVIYLHRENIKRLLAGKENKVR